MAIDRFIKYGSIAVVIMLIAWAISSYGKTGSPVSASATESVFAPYRAPDPSFIVPTYQFHGGVGG